MKNKSHSKYATPYKYAKLCDVSTQAIYERIKNGSLTTIQKEDINGEVRSVIDLKKYPPVKSTAGVRLK